MGDAGFCAMLNGLSKLFLAAKQSPLRILDVSKHRLGTSSLQKLAECLMHGSSLKAIYMRDNLFTKDDLSAFDNFRTTPNRRIHLDLEGNYCEGIDLIRYSVIERGIVIRKGMRQKRSWSSEEGDKIEE